MKVKLVSDKVGGYTVFIDDTKFGSFDQINGNSEPFCYFPQLTDRMTGDHFVAVGNELNKLNQKFKLPSDDEIDEQYDQAHPIIID